MKLRTDLSGLNDEEYRAYKRKWNAKRQKKYRAMMKRQGVSIPSNLSVNQRVVHYALTMAVNGMESPDD